MNDNSKKNKPNSRSKNFLKMLLFSPFLIISAFMMLWVFDRNVDLIGRFVFILSFIIIIPFTLYFIGLFHGQKMGVFFSLKDSSKLSLIAKVFLVIIINVIFITLIGAFLVIPSL